MRLWAPRGVPPARLTTPTKHRGGPANIYNSGRTTIYIWSSPGRPVRTSRPAGSDKPASWFGRAGRLLGRGDRLARHLFEQRLAALPAESRTGAVGRPAPGAGACGPRLLEAQDPLHLAQLGIGILEQRRALDQHIDPHLLTDSNLVDEPAEVVLELGRAGGELVAPTQEVDRGLVRGLGRPRRKPGAVCRARSPKPHQPHLMARR